jgi:perosamine synthetase
MACFSFHPRKTISLGEGGILTMDDAALADRARRLRSHGASVSDHARHQAKGLVYEEYVELGYNYRMTDVEAAIGLEQMRKLDGFLARRKQIARRYDEAFGPLQGVQVPAHPPYASHAYQSYGIRLLPECRADRDQVLRDLVALGISCRRGIPPIHLEPLYRDRFGRVSLPVTEDVAARSIFLPMFASLSGGDQQRVIDAVVGMTS